MRQLVELFSRGVDRRVMRHDAFAQRPPVHCPRFGGDVESPASTFRGGA
jgi:hypothetical protein